MQAGRHQLTREHGHEGALARPHNHGISALHVTVTTEQKCTRVVDTCTPLPLPGGNVDGALEEATWRVAANTTFAWPGEGLGEDRVSAWLQIDLRLLFPNNSTISTEFFADERRSCRFHPFSLHSYIFPFPCFTSVGERRWDTTTRRESDESWWSQYKLHRFVPLVSILHLVQSFLLLFSSSKFSRKRKTFFLDRWSS